MSIETQHHTPKQGRSPNPEISRQETPPIPDAPSFSPKSSPDQIVEDRATRIHQEQKRTAEIGIINNRPKREKTERPVFNVEGLKDKNQLTYQDVKEYVEADRAELQQVAHEMNAILGIEMTTEKAQFLVYGRMVQLWQEAIKTIRGHENAVDNKMYALRQEKDRLQSETSHWWNRFSADYKNKRDGIQQIDQERAVLETKSGHRPNMQSGRTYEVHESTIQRAMRYPAKDAILLYDDKGEKRALRLNEIQLSLAQRGVFYKGEPTNNVFDEKSKNPTWDQAAYPQSALEFYKLHMADWVKSYPAEAQKILNVLENPEKIS